MTGLLRDSIEEQFSDIYVEGELSNLRAPGSGHVYCTLKDKTSQIRAVLFRSSAVRLRFALQEGMQVIVRGRLTVYEPRGEYQIVLDTVEPKGIGALQIAFEQLKERLTAEGLFDQDRKKSIPAFPRTVGVVTSLTGAAIRDILAVLRRRWPTIHILIAPVQVQGESAGRQIAKALGFERLGFCGCHYCRARRRVVGGSLEFQRGDRGACYCRIPCTSGVGGWA